MDLAFVTERFCGGAITTVVSLLAALKAAASFRRLLSS